MNIREYLQGPGDEQREKMAIFVQYMIAAQLLQDLEDVFIELENSEIDVAYDNLYQLVKDAMCELGDAELK